VEFLAAMVGEISLGGGDERRRRETTTVDCDPG